MPPNALDYFVKKDRLSDGLKWIPLADFQNTISPVYVALRGPYSNSTLLFVSMAQISFKSLF
jgi:hypothetical protein